MGVNMPVTLYFPESGKHSLDIAAYPINSLNERDESSSKELAIGLLNNMGDGALEATERQFISLLNAAAEDFHIRLSLYHFPEVPRRKSAKRHLDRRYHSVESLWNSKLDGLIVTGREPVAPSLRDEPYWDSFVQVHEWARENTFATIWSCLAAHAAVLHMDGIERQRSRHKHYGIFECVQVSEHPVLKHISASFRLPHSRWNGLPEAELTQCGYQVLTRAVDAGVDCFVKQDSSLFVYFQGHPEYEADTLLFEYRRDVIRYLNGESAAYPSVPGGYFDRETRRNLLRVQHEAASRPHRETLALASSIASSVGKVNGWGITASTFYRNWLEHMYTQKSAREQRANAAAASCVSTLPEPFPNMQREMIGGSLE